MTSPCHAASSTGYSYVSAKSHSNSQTVSPPWSAGSLSPPSHGHALVGYGPSTPGAPRMGPVSLPATTTYGLSTPPQSPTAIRTPFMEIHPALVLRHPPTMFFNLLLSINRMAFMVRYPTSPMPELATRPPTTRLSINVPQLPQWSFTVENPNGVTVYDVLVRIHSKMNGRVTQAEWQSQFSESAQQTATASFQARTSGDDATRQDGVKRVDFLGANTWCAGLRADGSTGRWDVLFIPRSA
ncbi:hypothetical protein JAAARDRAFT_191235 [Jaapia argillacea MUCL 33604]|uniref:DUF6699 domain-containing protein n=1 Tax=Jaapia argillacea MUCL 33604 TaxID=933084 RepID=A0A067Q2C8_9AGAM|nr:hypothetical protein JAAARDRAFT_191235 [Jaapia argillacea MUCL 33604]